jgi:hypothetical protein
VPLSLEERISQLEARLGQLFPNITTIDPATGDLLQEFDGKVNATEIDLVAADTIPPASPIKWITTGGALVAELVSDSHGNLSLSPGNLDVAGSLVGHTVASDTTVNAGTDIHANGNVGIGGYISVAGDIRTTGGSIYSNVGDLSVGGDVTAGNAVNSNSVNTGSVSASGLIHSGSSGISTDGQIYAVDRITTSNDLYANDVHATIDSNYNPAVVFAGLQSGADVSILGQYSTSVTNLAAGATVDLYITDARWTLGSGQFTQWLFLGYIGSTAGVTWGIVASDAVSITPRLRNVSGANIGFAALFGFMVGTTGGV